MRDPPDPAPLVQMALKGQSPLKGQAQWWPLTAATVASADSQKTSHRKEVD
jgi:hypothetical protein